MEFKFWFHGRKRGAIGCAYDQSFTCQSANQEAAEAFLRTMYEVWTIKLVTCYYRITFENGSTMETGFNGTLAEAEAYYIGNPQGFRLSYDESGPLLKAVKVEQI